MTEIPDTPRLAWSHLLILALCLALCSGAEPLQVTTLLGDAQTAGDARAVDADAATTPEGPVGQPTAEETAALAAPRSAPSLTPPPSAEAEESSETGPSPANGQSAPDLALAPLVQGKASTSAVPDAAREFNNACKPPEPVRTPIVPKSIRALRQQVGTEFHVSKRGQFLVASDLAAGEHANLVDGVLACCRECLVTDYFSTPVKRTVTIYVFRDEVSYTGNLERLFRMNPISPYGHYGHRQSYIVINYETGSGTLVHELTHALMADDFPEAPIWISEGMASLYEQCSVEEDSLRGDPNWRLPELRHALREGSVTPIGELMMLSPRQFRTHNESQHYAEARYWCYYLEQRGWLRKVYAAFRDGYAQDPTGVRAIETVTGQSLASLEADWHRWLARQQWSPAAHE